MSPSRKRHSPRAFVWHLSFQGIIDIFWKPRSAGDLVSRIMSPGLKSALILKL